MSVVIAVRDKNRFVLGADAQVSCGGEKSHTGNKVWEIKEYPGCCMGAVGSARASQIIASVKGLLDGLPFGTPEVPDEFIVLALPRCIYETLKNHGIEELWDQDGQKQLLLPCEFFFAYKDRCWCIHRDMTVEEVEEYMAIGSGGAGAEHSMDTAVLFYKEKNPFKLIAQAIDIVAERTLYVDHNVNYVSTSFEETDFIKIAEAIDPDQAKAIKDDIKAKKLAEKEAKRKAAEKKAKQELKKQNKAKNETVEPVNEPEETK